jgi:thiamine biosynthesis lipoprotein
MHTVAVAREAMATRFEVLLQGEDAVRLRAAAEQALDEIERLEAQLSLFIPTSEISHVNRRAATEPVHVSPPVFRLLEQAQRLSQETGGAFDPTVAPLVRCWGFMGGGGALPEPPALAQARAKVGMDKVELDERNFTVRFARSGMMLDLGAIGKGYAIERAAELLAEAGVASAFLHGGTSSSFALGKPLDAEAWKASISLPPDLLISGTAPAPAATHAVVPNPNPNRNLNPNPNPSPPPSHPRVPSDAPPTAVSSAIPPAPLAVVPLENESLSVSAVWGKSFAAQGRTWGHVLDPRSGEPVQRALLAALVLPSATEGDALSTALLTLGPEGLETIARLRPGARALLVVPGAEASHCAVLARGIAWRDADR